MGLPLLLITTSWIAWPCWSTTRSIIVILIGLALLLIPRLRHLSARPADLRDQNRGLPPPD